MASGGGEDEEAARALGLAREVAALRTSEGARRRELGALRDKVAALAARLQETTDELAQRAQFAADAVAQMARLEADAAAAKRSVLSREMQLQDAARDKRALEAALQTKERECARWEAEFQRVDALLGEQQCAYAALEGALNCKRRKGRQRKAQTQRLAASLDDMKQHVERLRDKERRLARVLEAKDASAAALEQTWTARLEREQHVVASLHEQVRELEAESRRAAQSEAQRARDAVAEEKRAAAENLRSQLRDSEQTCDRLRTKEQLLRREVGRLREELLLSESQRATDQRRHEQLMRGRDKEVAFVWQKYVGAVSSRARADQRTHAGHRGSDVPSSSSA